MIWGAIDTGRTGSKDFRIRGAWFWLGLLAVFSFLMVGIFAANGAEAAENRRLPPPYIFFPKLFGALDYQITPETVNYLSDCPEYFPALSDEAYEEILELADGAVSYRELKANIHKYRRSFIRFQGRVLVSGEDPAGVATVLVVSVKGPEAYLVAYRGTLDSIFDGSRVDVIGMPETMASWSDGATAPRDVVVVIGSSVLLQVE